MQDVVTHCARFLSEGDSDAVRSGRDMPPDVLKSSIDPRDGCRLLHVHSRQVLIAPQPLLEHLDIIDGDEQGIGVQHAPDIPGAHETVDAELIVRVGGKVVLDEDAAPGAERQALTMDVPASVRRPVIDAAARTGSRISNRLDADLTCR